MFISKRELFDEYCKWLFDIIFEFYTLKSDEISKRDFYQSRAVGFLSERLLNVYVEWKIEMKGVFYMKQAFIN